MADDSLYLLNGREVLASLAGRELEIIEAVGRAYVTHGAGQSSLPHSMFLRFPEQPRDRIIALPAFLGGETALAGVKWIASFPGNLALGIDRASATLILNSTQTGRPTAILEASVVSAKRTAASAALAARELAGERKPTRIALVGCGLIQFEIARFLHAVFGGLPPLRVFDLNPARAEQFCARLRQVLGAEAEIAPSLAAAFAGADLASFATTSGAPYVESLDGLAEDAIVLHISLRDLAPAIVLAADNTVDDVDHAVRERTSLHLAEQEVGHRGFVRGTLAEILTGAIPPRVDGQRAIFSPFGLGVLDLAVAHFALERARVTGEGLELPAFVPPSWTEWP